MPDRASATGSNLRPFRLRAAMTQEELALKAGVGTRTIRDIESGKVRPQPKTLRLLAAALGLADAEALLTRPQERAAAAPRELPRPLTGFAGRERHLHALLTAVADGAAVIAVHGMAGVGKTSLALWAAHELAPDYPDGQLFVDLHGFTQSVAPRPGLRSVLTRVLRGLGVPDRDVPVDIDELTARYRSVIADRRILLVFDNAAGAEQLEPLLPATPGSLVLATSRRDLSPLAGAHSVPLDPPTADDAAAMLSAAVPGRATHEEAAAVAERCGRLPLAIGLAAARLRSRPHWHVEDLLARLADEDRLLDELDMGHRGVAAALRASYHELDPAHRRLLRRLGLLPGDDADAHAAAALCGVEADRAAAMLESLVDVHLVETRSPGRYRLHDLVRLFASRLAALEDTEAETDDAFLRLADTYLHFAARAAAWVWPNPTRFTGAAPTPGHPAFADRPSALAWFHAERGNLEAAVTAAERAGHLALAWRLATAFNTFMTYDPDIDRHLGVNQVALDLARRLADLPKEAHSLGDRGRHLLVLGRHDEAIGHLDRAVALHRETGDLASAALTLANLGILHRRSGRFVAALEVYEQARTLAEDAADPSAAVSIEVNMFFPLFRLGRLTEAERCLASAEARLRDDHDRLRIASSRGSIARMLGDPARALSAHTACLEASRRDGIPGGVTNNLHELGEDLLAIGRLTEAVAHLRDAVERAEDQSYASMERSTRNSLGRALTASGEPADAIAQHERAAELAESAGDAYELARAHHGFADAHALLGDRAAERRHLERAARGYADCGVPEAETVAERLAAL